MSLHERVTHATDTPRGLVSGNELSDYKWFFEQEANTWAEWISLPFKRRLWLWRHGFTSPMGKLYDFEKHGPDAYLSELQRYRLYTALNSPHRHLLDDKLSQHWMLADYPQVRPTAFGFVDGGFVHGMAGSTFEGEPTSVGDWFPEVLRHESKLVLKELRGKGGEEVLVCEYDDGYAIDGEPVTEAELCAEIKNLSGYLVTEHISQHSYADDLYPHASNTIRLITVWDDAADDLFVPVGIQRIGTEISRPLDNCSAGGLTAEIDLETGEIGRAVRIHYSEAMQWRSTHPDTGAQIEGERVPNWETVRSTVERIARDNTHIPIIGWDVLLDESGEPIVIEANTGPDVDLMQVHAPLLADDRFASLASDYLESVDDPTTSENTGRADC